MDDQKRKLFSNISDFSGPSKELRLLEVGCGSGANFKYYPSGCKVTCLDINPNFEKFLSKNQAKNDHLIYERFVVASADNMTSIVDGSMDVVVCTLLACSVPNIPAVVKEVKRVLRTVTWDLIPSDGIVRHMRSAALTGGGAQPIAAGCQLTIAADIRHYVPGAVTDRYRHINPRHTAIKHDRSVSGA
ncbi:unnamed protein product [Ranitomeya imitator]|uniref:Methyltransferase type 11 domain-containing protein n=1 Tax=Ranitomeya imitator TaxID=111125 RepID=A0ABN9LGF1_9NEOB|nr:unnamed protein product [Ranitomeya imitator]